MRTLAFGDIHGCYKALTTAVQAARVTDQDALVFLGDYVDRGPDSRKVIDWLLERQARQPVVTLRGNHEIMMLRARDGVMACQDWFFCGGDATLKSYGAEGAPEWEKAIPERHWEFLNQTAPWYETAKHLYVHGTLDPGKDLAEQSETALYWVKFEQAAPHKSGKPFICGHTVQKQGVPTNLGFAICIDTGVYKGQWLTCLDPDTGRYWQGNEQGGQREGRLAPALG